MTTSSPLPASIFRAYDIRGIVDKDLTTEGVTLLGRAIGSEARTRGQSTVIIGRDGRLSGPTLSKALAKGLQASGCNVIDIGMVPTPVLYFAASTLKESSSGVAVTGSHNPPDYNGFKIMIGGETLSGDTITALYDRIVAGDFTEGQGHYKAYDIREEYLNRITAEINLKRPLKAVVDCGNGVTGELGPELVRRLGVDVIPLFDDIDGHFPNHHPDPGKVENLQDLIKAVKKHNADIGLAFDGDGDRLGVVTPQGKIIYPDHLMMAFSEDLLKRSPGEKIIFDVKCTGNLARIIEQAGGSPEMSRTGHSLIKAKMKETNAALAGEMSGHIFFKERWYGFDDGIYSAARLLEILSGQHEDADTFFSRYPQDIGTAEINVTVTDNNKFDLVKRLATETDFGQEATRTTIDGIRVDYPDCWGLCRASNTTPVLVFRFEGKTEQALEGIKSRFRTALKQIAPDVSAPF